MNNTRNLLDLRDRRAIRNNNDNKKSMKNCCLTTLDRVPSSQTPQSNHVPQLLLLGDNVDHVMVQVFPESLSALIT